MYSMFEGELEDLHTMIVCGTVLDIRRCILTDPGAVHRHNSNGLTPLHLAVQREADDVNEVIDILVMNGANVNCRTVPDGDTPLHLVVRMVELSRAMSVARKLLNWAANRKSTNKLNKTPYDYAIFKGYQQLADLLGADGWLQDDMALIKAVSSGPIEDVQKCLDYGADVNCVSEVGAAPIHYLFSHRKKTDKQRVLEILSRSGLRVNKLNREGDSPINVAISYMSPGNEMFMIVSKLIDLGCDQTIKNKSGKEAVDLAKAKGYKDIVALLEGSSMKVVKKHLFKAIILGDTKSVKELLQREEGAVMMYNENGLNTIHAAVVECKEQHRPVMIKTLKEGGADVNAQTEGEKDTPLHMAVRLNQPKTCQQLIDLKADIEKKNSDGKTPYDLAKQLNFKECIDIFDKVKKPPAEPKTEPTPKPEPKKNDKKKDTPPKGPTCSIL